MDLPVGQLPFDYSLERIIDDFILLAIFIGNDFLPHLPDFHINENALETLFDIYKLVLPKAGGYIVHQGTINMERLQLVLDELANGEEETFLRETADLQYFQGKQRKHVHEAGKSKPHSDSGECCQRHRRLRTHIHSQSHDDRTEGHIPKDQAVHS